MVLTDGPVLETYIWGVDSELEAADEPSKDRTDELPIVRPAGVDRAMPHDDGFVVHNPLPGA